MPLHAHREKLIEPKIAEHEDRIVKVTGDGLLAEFAGAVEAVGCAAEDQHTVAERDAEAPEASCIVCRIRINLDDIIIDG